MGRARFEGSSYRPGRDAKWPSTDFYLAEIDAHFMFEFLRNKWGWSGDHCDQVFTSTPWREQPEVEWDSFSPQEQDPWDQWWTNFHTSVMSGTVPFAQK